MRSRGGSAIDGQYEFTRLGPRLTEYMALYLR